MQQFSVVMTGTAFGKTSLLFIINHLWFNSYEFTFKKRAVSLEDRIDTLFNNADVIKIELTDRVGLDQIRDDICR